MKRDALVKRNTSMTRFNSTSQVNPCQQPSRRQSKWRRPKVVYGTE